MKMEGRGDLGFKNCGTLKECGIMAERTGEGAKIKEFHSCLQGLHALNLENKTFQTGSNYGLEQKLFAAAFTNLNVSLERIAITAG